MSLPKVWSFLIPFVTVCLILGISVLIIAYGRGYRFDVGKKSLKATGLLVASSEPSGAQILINGKVRSATPSTLNLPPDWHTIRIVKDGFQAWEKRVRVQGEVVAKIEALLLPTNPSLTAITAMGVGNPILSPDGGKLVYVVPRPTPGANNGRSENQAGVWVLELVDKPLGMNRDARQVAASDSVDFSKATLTWSPDSKEVLTEVPIPSTKNPRWYLLEADRLNRPILPVTDAAALRKEWNTLREAREREKLITLKEEFVAIATSSTKLLAFSPDETKILHEATASATLPQIIKPSLIGTNSTPEVRELTPGKVYVYDIKEDRNYILGSVPEIPLQWLPTSRHLLAVSRDRIEILDYDGENRRTAYAGPFWDSFAVPWTNASRIVILTNLNPKASTVNNLYAVNLR